MGSFSHSDALCVGFFNEWVFMENTIMRWLKNTKNGREFPYTEKLAKKPTMVEINEDGKIINSGDPQKARDVFKLLDEESDKRRQLEIQLAKKTKQLEDYIKIYGRLGNDVRVEGAKKMEEANEAPIAEEPEAPEEVPAVEEAPVVEESSPEAETELFTDYSKKMLIEYLESQDVEIADKVRKSKSLKVKEQLRQQAIKLAKG